LLREAAANDGAESDQEIEVLFDFADHGAATTSAAPFGDGLLCWWLTSGKKIAEIAKLLWAKEESYLIAFKIATEILRTYKVVRLVPRGDVGLDKFLQLVDDPIGAEKVV